MASLVTCPSCNATQIARLGITRDFDAVQYYRCGDCGCVFAINTARDDLAPSIVVPPSATRSNSVKKTG